MGRKVKRKIFDEMILGISGRDALAYLDGLSKAYEAATGRRENQTISKPKSLQEEIEACPLRYRLIYKGFVNTWSLDELNEKLKEKKEEKLYARNLLEATLIYAFKKNLSFEKWKSLVLNLKELEKEGSYDDLLINGFHGSYSAFPLERIRNYVKNSSLLVNGNEYTLQRTKTVEIGLKHLSDDRDFVLYICENIRVFCEGREKARYYICKYFLAYLNTKINFYLTEGISRTAKRNIYLDLPLSNISKMDPNRHANMSRDEVLETLAQAKVSSNKLFELLNRFYSYVLLADSKAEDPNWEEYSLMSKVLQGDSISRNLLILLLLFFESEAELADEGMKLSERRFNEILKACSFEELSPKKSQIDEMLAKVLSCDDRRRALERILYETEEIAID